MTNDVPQIGSASITDIYRPIISKDKEMNDPTEMVEINTMEDMASVFIDSPFAYANDLKMDAIQR